MSFYECVAYVRAIRHNDIARALLEPPHEDNYLQEGPITFKHALFLFYRGLRQEYQSFKIHKCFVIHSF